MWADKEGGYPETAPNEMRDFFRTHDPAEWITDKESQEKYRSIFGLSAMLRAVKQQGLCEHAEEKFVHKPAFKVGIDVPETPPKSPADIAADNMGLGKGDKLIIDLILEVLEEMKSLRKP